MTVLISSSLVSFTTDAKKKNDSSYEAATRIVAAFQKSSSFEYSELIPSIHELHGLMKENEALYGPYLQDAGQEMTNDYVNNFLPAIDKSFDAVIEEGIKRGIEWSKIQFVSFETDASESQSPSYFTVVISSNGKHHSIRIDNAFFVHGQFRANQHIKLI